MCTLYFLRMHERSGPITRGDSGDGLARLRVLMKSMTLRRTKALLVDTLPPKTVEVHTLKLDAAHREAYNLLHRYSGP
jgi:SNF2 family DNA or RNA helicase